MHAKVAHRSASRVGGPSTRDSELRLAGQSFQHLTKIIHAPPGARAARRLHFQDRWVCAEPGGGRYRQLMLTGTVMQNSEGLPSTISGSYSRGRFASTIASSSVEDVMISACRMA